jgi:hypothetical protein
MRVNLFAALAAAWFLAGCISGPGESVPLGPFPEAPVLADSSSGFLLSVPDGWIGSSETSPPRYLELARAVPGALATVVVTAAPYPESQDPVALRDDLAEAKRSEYGSGFLFVSGDTDRVAGVKAGVLRYLLQRSGEPAMLVRQHLLLRKGYLILISCSDERDAFATRETEFDAILSKARWL